MALQRRITAYKKADLHRIIGEDFRASEADRYEKNVENLLANKQFYCLDANQPLIFRHIENNVRGRAPIEGTPKYRNSVYLPYSRSIVLAAETLIGNGLFPDFQDFFRLTGRTEQDQKSAEVITDVLKFYLKEADFVREVMLCIRQMLKYDFAVLYTGWKRDLGLVPVLKQNMKKIYNWLHGEWIDSNILDGPPETQWKMKMGAVDRPEFKAINTFNFRYDPHAGHDDFNSCDWCGLTYTMSKRQMKILAETGVWDKAVIAKISDDEPMEDTDSNLDIWDYDAFLRREQRLGSAEGPEPSDGDYYTKRRVRVKQYNTDDGVVWEINGKYIAGKRDMLGIPFTVFKTFEIEGMFNGESLMHSLMTIQEDINTSFRNFRQMQNRAGTPTPVYDARWFRSPRTEIPIHAANPQAPLVLTRWVPGANAQNAVFYLTPPSATVLAADTWNSLQTEMQMGERVSSINDNAQGAPRPGGERTATEATYMAQGTASRVDYHKKRTEVPGIVKPIDRTIKLMHMNAPREIFLRIEKEKGAEYKRITPGDMALEAPLDIIATGMAAMQARAAGMDFFTQIVFQTSQNPMFAPWLNARAIIRDMFVGANKDPRVFLNTDVKQYSGMSQDDELVLLANGYDVAVNPTDNHYEHMMAIVKFVSDKARFALVPEDNKQKIIQHGLGHKQFMEQMKMKPGQMSPAGGAATYSQAPGMAAAAPLPQGVNMADQSAQMAGAPQQGFGAPVAA